MTADEKVRLAQALWIETWRVTAAGVRARHQDWSEEQIVRKVQELMSVVPAPCLDSLERLLASK